MSLIDNLDPTIWTEISWEREGLWTVTEINSKLKAVTVHQNGKCVVVVYDDLNLCIGDKIEIPTDIPYYRMNIPEGFYE